MSLNTELATVLSEAKDGTLATLRPDGWPQATIISFVADGETLWFDCLKSSQKADNLALDPRVSMTVMIPYVGWGDIYGFSLTGRVRRLSAVDEIDAVIRLWRAKFPYMNRVLTANSDDFVFFELKTERAERMDFKKGLGHGHTPRTAEDLAPIRR